MYRDGQGFQATAVDLLGELTRNARPMLLVLIGFVVGLIAKFLMPGRDGGGFFRAGVVFP